MRKLVLFMLGMILALAGFSVRAGGFDNRQGRWTLGAGGGVTVDPTMGAIQAQVNYYVTDEVSFGPMAQYEFSGDDWAAGFSGQAKYSAILANNKVVRPYGQVGVGFLRYRVDRWDEDDTKTTYLFPVGGGFEFKLSDQLSLDANGIVNISNHPFGGIFVGVQYIY